MRAIVGHYLSALDFEGLESQLNSLIKKRGALKQAITSMVRECIEFCTGTYCDKKLQVLNILKNITEGKMYLETEKAEVAQMLALLYETSGKIKEAADSMLDVQVETFSSLNKTSKVKFILEQIRLAILTSNFSKALLVSRKITPKSLETLEDESIKLKYFELMIKLYYEERDFLKCSKFNRSISSLKSVVEDKEKMGRSKKLAVIFLVLSPQSTSKVSEMQSLSADKFYDTVPLYRELLNIFQSQELINWSSTETFFGPELNSFREFSGDQDCWSALKERVIEHNIKTIGCHYSSLTFAKFAQLIGADQSEAEKYLQLLINSGQVTASIDRTTGIVLFSVPESSNYILNQWNDNVDSILSVLVKTSHQIGKEEISFGGR